MSNLSPPAGAVVPPGGAGGDTEVQFNDAGAFAGSADYTFDKTDLWTYGGSTDTVNMRFGSDAAATLAAGQHFLDLGNTLQQDPGSGTNGQVIRFKGVGVLGNSTLYYGIDTGGRLFLMTDVTHRWHFNGGATHVYEWGAGTFSMTERTVPRGVLTVGFSNGEFTFTNQQANQRTFQINANNTVTTNAATTLFILGTVNGTEDMWEYRCTGTNANLRFRSAGVIDLLPVGIRASTGDFGVRIAPDQQLILTLSGFFGFVDVQNQDFTGSNFWRPNSGTGTGFAYGAGSVTALNIRTDLASGSSFFAYGANLNHSSGSGTVGFWQYRNNGSVVGTMSLIGDLLAGDYTGLGDQNLVVTAGARSGTGAGLDIEIRGSAGAGAGAQNGGNIILASGAQSGGGLDGVIQIQSNVTTTAVGIHEIGTAANSFAFIYANSCLSGDNLDASLEAGVVTASGNGRTVTLLASNANTSGTGGDVIITPGAGAGGSVAGRIRAQAHLSRDTDAGITASTTQSQGQQPLVADVNEVSVVANTNDVVTMPTAFAGLKVIIINNGANTAQIFPASGDDMGGGVDTAITIAAAARLSFTAYDATNWENI